jgi:2-methylcitrate dehydratase PrpD
MITATGATAEFAERVVAAGTMMSEAALERANAAILDTLGVMLAGSREPAAHILARSVQSTRGSRLIGTALCAPAPDAALANGTSAHALDFDDVSPAMVGHPSAVLVPALLAIADETDASGTAVLDAYVVGFEVAARLGRALNPQLQAACSVPPGSPEQPLTQQQLEQKFLANATPVLGAAGAAHALAALNQIGEAEGVRDVLALVCP